uniref:Uncharacterized protein n=2 Tax=Caenorhabditis japonica TaxID=281687 RepID=A0A8R1I927_CAEJA
MICRFIEKLPFGNLSVYDMATHVWTKDARCFTGNTTVNPFEAIEGELAVSQAAAVFAGKSHQASRSPVCSGTHADALSHRTIAACRGPPPTTEAPSAALHIKDCTVSRRPFNAMQPTNQRSPETF